MPELPEVETIRRSLEKRIIGRAIVDIELLNPKSFHGDPFHAIGQKILNVKRKGKVLMINLTQDLTLLIHLKMSGQVILDQDESTHDLTIGVSTLNRTSSVVGKPTTSQSLFYRGTNEKFIGGHPTIDMSGKMPNKSTRIIFKLGEYMEKGSKVNKEGVVLYFNDQRKFGWVKLVDREQVRENRFLNSLGPEPLEEGFSWTELKKNLLKHKKTAVKVALLDQSTVAGVGNIYACEACFMAGILPEKRIEKLTDEEFKRIHKGVIDALKNGIKYGGSSKTHFVDPEGKKGLFLDYAYVYLREKKPCKICGTTIKKIRLGGRGTFFCPKCQYP